MEKRQALIGGIAAVVLLAAGGFWWVTNMAEPVEEEIMAIQPKPEPKPAEPGAPAVPAPVTPAPESDAVALGEEEADRIKAEVDDLAARAADLEEQVRDGEMILDAQAKNIAKLEAELKALGVKPAEPKKK